MGKGKEPFILCNGLGGQAFAWAPIYNELGDKFKFITWDYRGLFTSENPGDTNALTIPDHVNDLEKLCAAEKITKAHFGGWSMGVQVCLEFYRKHAKLYKSIFLLNGTYGNAYDTALNSPLSKYLLPIVNDLLKRVLPTLQPKIKPLAATVINSAEFVKIVTSLGLIHENFDSKIFQRVAAEMMNTDLTTYHYIMDHMAEHSAGDVLKKITVPTLIVASTKDVMTPHHVAEEMAEKITNAELLILNNASHYSLMEFPEIIVGRLKQFISEHFT